MSSDGVAAVDRALAILDVFTERDRSLTLTEISKRTGYYKSTTLRLAESLEKFNYLRRADDGSYRLGHKPLLLGALYQTHFRTGDHVPRILKNLVDQWNEGASFFINEGDKRVCLHRVDAQRAIRDSIREGDSLALGIGASGHVLLAFSGEAGEKYDQVRKQMFAASFGERDPETAAYSVPVFGPNQKLVGAISLSGPKYRFESLDKEAVIQSLFACAAELSEVFGGRAAWFPKKD